MLELTNVLELQPLSASSSSSSLGSLEEQMEELAAKAQAYRALADQLGRFDVSGRPVRRLVEVTLLSHQWAIISHLLSHQLGL